MKIIQKSWNEALYMSSTLTKVMLFIPWHPISLYGGGGALSHTDSKFLYTVIWTKRYILHNKSRYFVVSGKPINPLIIDTLILDTHV